MLTLYLGTSLDSGEGCVMEHTTDTCTHAHERIPLEGWWCTTLIVYVVQRILVLILVTCVDAVRNILLKGTDSMLSSEATHTCARAHERYLQKGSRSSLQRGADSSACGVDC